MKNWMSLTAAGTAALATALYAPTPASACGGFFCSRQQMDQAGENILFSVEGDGTLTAHIQILYQGEADRFAWILPLPNIPDSVGVGTDALFQQVAQQTRPLFSLDFDTEGTCRDEPPCGWDDSFESADRGAGGRADSDAGPAADPGSGPTIYLREVVGPYDAVVLGGGTAEELLEWLADNDFDIPVASRPIVAEYAAAHHVFVAIRLLSDRSTREIQPLVLHYPEGQPCVPLRLTAIATVPDMPITAYFAADAYAAPFNFSAVEPSYDEPGLWTGALSYMDYVGREVDDAGGRGFVTEYAGDVPAVSLELASVEDLATTTEPGEFLRQLRSRNFVGDSQLLGILARFLPPPDPSDPQSFFNCLFFGSRAGECGFMGDFDPAGLVGALTEQIVTPRREAQAMLARHSHFTRLFTTMSADEMTLDPLFRIDAGLPAVSNRHEARMVTECGPDYFRWTAPQRIELPSGRVERVREGIVYRGDDETYCEDRASGAFSPWTERERLIETAERRNLRAAGGGAICSATPGARGLGVGLSLMGLALLALSRRRWN